MFIQMMLTLIIIVATLIEASSLNCPKPCRCYRRKGQIIADCSNQKLRDVPRDFPPTTSKLVLDNNLLTQLHSDCFSGMASLQEISVKTNQIGTVDVDAFKGLGNLTKIQLTKNLLSALPPGVFSDNPHLKLIYLTSNRITSIPNFNPMPPKFNTLGLDSNKITSAKVPDGYLNVTMLKLTLSNNHELGKITKKDFENLRNKNGGGGKLVTLRLSHCGLTSIENGSLANQTQLTSITLSYNKISITNLLGIFEDLKSSSHLNYLNMDGIITKDSTTGDLNFDALKGKRNLHTVSLSHNVIPVLHNHVFKAFEYVKILFLKHCQIRVAEAMAFDGMNQLERIDLFLNKLSLLPNFPRSLGNLKTLDLSNNHDLDEIEDNSFINLTKLTSLKLNYCGVTKIHKNSFLGLTMVKTLEIIYNKLPNIPNLVHMISLASLNLRNNRLMIIPLEYQNIFQGLGQLTHLDLSSNQMNSFPETMFQPLMNLTWLDLNNNRLDRMVQRDGNVLFSYQVNLKFLNLEKNNIKRIPDEMFKNLRSLETIKLSNNEIYHWGSGSFNTTLKLRELSMAKNQISLINETSVSGFHSSMKWNLSGNPFSCGCDLRWFRRWINRTKVTLLNVKGYTCDSPQSMFGIPLLDFNPDSVICWHFPWYYALGGGVSASALLIITLVSVLYRFRWPIRYRWFLFRRKGRMNEDDKNALVVYDSDYDAIICFSGQADDRDWIENYLMPAMDEKDEDVNNVCEPGTKFNLWYQERDLEQGKGKTEIFEVIRHSKMMILVISKKFHKEAFCRYIIETQAPMMASESVYQHNALIFIILEEGADLQIPGWYHKELQRGEQLTWTPNDLNGQRLFWQRLRDRLTKQLEL